MPVYDVQNAKINGQNEYFLDYSFNVVSTGCTAPTWSATAVYTAGSVVQFNGMKYTAWYWTQGQQPDLNYGAQATGKPWNQNGPCGSSTCTAPLWNSSTAYTAGSVVQLNGLKYSAWYWTQNQDPSLNYGTQSSGKPWNLLGTCTSKAGLLSQSSSMEIHPNPASSQLTISLDAPAEDEVKIIVYDMLSRQVMEKENTIFSGQNDLSIDVSDLNTGLYTLSISNGNDRIVKQFVISK
jgi:chitodextrinase